MVRVAADSVGLCDAHVTLQGVLSCTPSSKGVISLGLDCAISGCTDLRLGFRKNRTRLLRFLSSPSCNSRRFLWWRGRWARVLQDVGSEDEPSDSASEVATIALRCVS